MLLLLGIRSRKVYSVITNGNSARVIVKRFSWRVMGFGFIEMAKSATRIEAKKLSTGSKRFSGSQHKSDSQNSLTQQPNRRMELQKTKSLARQRMY